MSQQPDPFALKKRDDAPKDIVSILQSESMRKQVELALPRHMRPDRMLRVMLTAINTNPKLKACTQTSLLAALMKCTQYGLEPDGRHAHLIPYKDDCQLIFDYKGLIQLVRRSGDVKSIHADVVYESDEFSYCYGTGAHLRHKPALDPKRRDKAPICAYSFVVMSTGEESFEVVSMEEIINVRDNSQGYQAFKKGWAKQSPWESSFDEMAKKTAFRRHTKWLPLSFETQDAVAADQDSDPDTRFKNAKVVTPTDLDAPRIELAPEPTTTIAANSDTPPEPEPTPTPEPPKRAAKPKPTPAQPSALAAIQAQATLEGISEGEIIEVLVRKNRTAPVESLAELSETGLKWAAENLEVIMAQIRMDRKVNEAP